MNTERIKVEKIHLDPNQPRETYDGIEGLSESMKNKGFMESGAISVQPHPEKDGEFMVIVGHRRTMAAKKAGLEEIPCFFYEGLSEKDIYEM